jgi:hypothetical protein
MADPVSLALKGASTAFEICRVTYNLIQGMRKAPADVRRVATDLTGFYGVLGALQSTIDEQRPLLATPGPAASQVENIAALLIECVAAWDQMEKDDVQNLRTHLSHIKLSLNVSLSSLTL